MEKLVSVSMAPNTEERQKFEPGGVPAGGALNGGPCCSLARPACHGGGGGICAKGSARSGNPNAGGGKVLARPKFFGTIFFRLKLCVGGENS